MKTLIAIIGFICFGVWCKSTDSPIGVAVREELIALLGGNKPEKKEEAVASVGSASFEELELERKIEAINSKIRVLISDAKRASYGARGTFAGSDHMFYQRSIERLEADKSVMVLRCLELKSARMGASYKHDPHAYAAIAGPETRSNVFVGPAAGLPIQKVSRVSSGPVIYYPATGQTVGGR